MSKAMLSYGERHKRRVHEHECQEAGINFVPLLVETLGGWSDLALSFIRQVAKIQALRLGQQPALSRHFSPLPIKIICFSLEGKCSAMGLPSPSCPSSSGWEGLNLFFLLFFFVVVRCFFCLVFSCNI